MYAGLENPISVSVPGVPNEKTHISCSNGTIVSKGNGKYVITNPKPGIPCKISVTADMENGEKRNMGEMDFRVKYLPKPEVSVSGIDGNKTSASKLASSLGLVVKYGPDFEFDAKPRVVSFTYSYSINGAFSGDKQVTGNLYDPTFQQNIKRLAKGSRVLIENIVAVGPDERKVSLNPISLTIN
jgi:hypothetical protein